MTGGPGADQVRTGKGANDVANGGADADRVYAESIGAVANGEDGADELFAKAQDNVLDGGDDADTLTGGKFADVGRGGGGADALLGGKGNDELRGGTENDTIDGGPGNDSLYGDEDTDTCTGSSGRDRCHGGAPGTEANTADDPDICSAEKKRSCKSGGGGTLSGTAAGTATVVGGDSDLVGVEESWNATFTMEEYFEDGYKGDASFGVVVDGTNEEGCTFAGSGPVTGQAELTIFEDTDDPAQSYYSVTLRVFEGSFDVTVSCPGTGTHTENWTPLQYPDLMRTYDYPFYESGMTQFNGDDSYETDHDQYEFDVDWGWNISF